METNGHVLERALPIEPRSPSAARHALDPLSGKLSESRLEDLRLLVTELVTNVLKHGKQVDDAVLRVRLTPSHVHVEVCQSGPPFEVGSPRSLPRERGSGWGFVLLDLLAEQWGVAEDPTRVWFEMPRD